MLKQGMKSVYAVHTRQNEWTVEVVVQYDGENTDVWGEEVGYQSVMSINNASIINAFNCGDKFRYVVPCLEESWPRHHGEDFSDLHGLPVPGSVLTDDQMDGFTSVNEKSGLTRHLLIFD